MKELSIEEKAKAYDEVLKKARMFYKDEHVDNEVNSLLEVLFPELKECKESDNEKIRKSIIEFVKQNKSFHYLLGVSKEDAIAWLEKQGEQKPQGKSALEAINEEKVDNANKVEPKQEKLTEFEKAVKQVMEKAINTKASLIMSVPSICISLPLGVNVGDKVKVIVIKED